MGNVYAMTAHQRSGVILLGVIVGALALAVLVGAGAVR